MKTIISGTRLGQYEVVGPLGSGGMGDVYRARDTRLDREIAVKVLPEDFSRDPDRVARFQREAKTLASLNHPHIAVIHDFQESGGISYLVLELVEGETLAQRIARGPIPPDEAIAIGIQIADALEAAHEKSIVHRDLKPANIKITPAGVVKVLDFGLARWTQTGIDPADMSNTPTIGANPTVAGVIMGTVAYMSPEQARGKTVDQRTDIWAFGCVLFEMLTGKQTFAGEDVTDIIAAVVKGEPNWLLLPPSMPSGLRVLLRRCLDKRPKERLHDMADARILLGEAQREPAAGESAAIVIKTYPRWMLVALAALSAMVVVLAGFVLYRRPAPAATSGTARSFVDLSSGYARQLSYLFPPVQTRPIQTMMAFSPDGQTVVYSTPKDGVLQLYRRPLDQLNAVPIDGASPAANPFFSPDGQFVGFLSSGKLKKIPLNGGPVADICDVPLYGFAGASWTTDNTIIFGDMEHGLSQVSADGGKPQPLTTLDKARHERAHVLPRLLPGGKAVLFTIQKSDRWEDADVALYVFATREQRILIPNGAADARYVSTGHLLYMRAGTLMAVPFDAARMQVTGSPAALIDDVMQSVYMPNVPYETFAGQFDVSPTGSLLYATGGPNPLFKSRLVWVDRRGHESALTDLDIGAYATPRISPDGKTIALSIFKENNRSNIWVYEIAHGTSRPLTQMAGERIFPFWSPVSKQIAFTGSNAFGVFLASSVSADKSEDPVTLFENDPGVYPAAWTPDGNGLLYVQDRTSGPEEFWLLPMAGERKPIPVLQPSTFRALHPEISPDGHWLAYSSNESGKAEVYVQAFPTSAGRKLVSNNSGFEPVWSRNGHELFYRRYDAATNKMQVWAVDVKTESAAFESGTPHLLFSGDFGLTVPLRNYDVSADGQRFLMVQNVEPAEKPLTRLVLVQNWFDELKRHVPTGH